MKYRNDSDNRYRVNFMRDTEKLMDELTVLEFIEYLSDNAIFEGFTTESIDGKMVWCEVYELVENGGRVKDFIVVNSRVFYARTLNHKIELVDKEEIQEREVNEMTDIQKLNYSVLGAWYEYNAFREEGNKILEDMAFRHYIELSEELHNAILADDRKLSDL